MGFPNSTTMVFKWLHTGLLSRGKRDFQVVMDVIFKKYHRRRFLSSISKRDLQVVSTDMIFEAVPTMIFK